MTYALISSREFGLVQRMFRASESDEKKHSEGRTPSQIFTLKTKAEVVLDFSDLQRCVEGSQRRQN